MHWLEVQYLFIMLYTDFGKENQEYTKSQINFQKPVVKKGKFGDEQ